MNKTNKQTKKQYLRPFQIGKMGGKLKKKKRKRKDIFILSRSRLRGGVEAGRFKGERPRKRGYGGCGGRGLG